MVKSKAFSIAEDKKLKNPTPIKRIANTTTKDIISYNKIFEAAAPA